MPLFQNAVLNKYLSGVDEKRVEEAWEKFTAHFHNTEIQENIRNSKEEAYQEGFLNDLFVKVLGYSKNPSPEYNLMVEQKNFNDSKKADGALLDGDTVRGVIELKGTETTDLGKVEPQAFGYKNKQPDAIYVIISNFEKLRFYIENAVDFIEFNLFQLTKEEFKVLWLCLGYPNFAKGLPKKIKDASLTEEENVTKELYNDYSEFKHAVFESMKEHNPEYDKLMLFKKTQKLLDRFLFIFFAEDRLLLPPNSIREIISQWLDLKEEYDAYVPLYDRFKKYFGYMNEGHKGKNHEIFAYNGGLFAEDEVLDKLDIEDKILYKYTQELSKYDFESEVDVNILGHIFEHSLNEIEEISAELKGEKVDSSKTRRKKDGVFYTPKYITKYIVEHTIGTLCEEKKAELNIVDERFTEAGRRSKKGISDLKEYREWLLDLTICDPACGSGAFLNQALEFLIAEHKYIDELQAKYHGEALVLSDIQDQILENNLYGVDINEESVEIAKLSLWLRTAQKGRKLTSLNNHIKCGNSLIDDPDLAGDKAFNWEEEFPGVFPQKQKQAYHITMVTHNSRTSQRMKDYKVKKGDSFVLDDELEVFVTKMIAEIVKEDDLNVLAYNICADHVHLILVCEPDNLPNIVRKLKGKSSQQLKEHLKVPKEEQFHLWAQKFNRRPIEDDQDLAKVQEYIAHNRKKHNLSPNKGLQSLVETLCCSYDYAFRPEFTGGFDVVIGNPPYAGRSSSINEVEKKYVRDKYHSYEGKFELYQLFIEKCFLLTSEKKAFISLITPQTWLSIKQATKIRSLVLRRSELKSIVFLGKNVFEAASVDTVIFTISRGSKNYEIEYFETDYLLGDTEETNSIKYSSIDNNSHVIPLNAENKAFDIIKRIRKNCLALDDIGIWSDGVKVVGKAKDFAFQRTKKNDSFHKMFVGRDIDRYYNNWGGLYCCRDKEEIERHDASDIRLREEEMFKRNKILIRKTGREIVATIDEKNKYYEQSLFSFGLNDEDVYYLKYILGVLNSQFGAFLLRTNAFSKKDTFPQIRLHWLKDFPIKKVSLNSQKLIKRKVNSISEEVNKLKLHNQELVDLLLSKFDIEKLSRKLQSWHELTFKQFLKELKKKKVKLSLEEEAEWMDYFNRQKAEADELKAQIDQTDKEIDAMVYQLYGLSEEEIAVVEGSVAD